MPANVTKGAKYLTVFAAYVTSGAVGLRFGLEDVGVTPLWAPSGIALASMLLLGYRLWPIVFLAAFAVNFTHTGALGTSLVLALGPTLGTLIAAYGINRYARGSELVRRAADVIRFALLGGLSAALVATFTVLMLNLAGLAAWPRAPEIWLTGWLGDVAGMVLVVPVVLLWALSRHESDDVPWRGETVCALIVLGVTGILLFGGLVPQHQLFFPLAYLFLPVLLWAALRLGPRATVAVSALITAISMGGTLSQRGPFVASSPNDSLLLGLAFLISTSAVALALAVLVRERAGVETGRHQLAEVVAASADAIVGRRLDGTVISWNGAAERLFGQRAEEMIGKPLPSLVPLSHSVDDQRMLATLKEGARIGRFEAVHRKHDGRAIDLSLTLSPIKDGQSVTVGVLLVAHDITERRKTEVALAASSHDLSVRFSQLEKNAEEIVLLSEMGSLLQTCNSEEDVFEVVATLAQQLFPTEPGLLAVVGRDAPHLMEGVVTWRAPLRSRVDFSFEECWALRRGLPYSTDSSRLGPFCQHLVQPLPARSLCVPLMAGGETLGVLHLEAHPDERGANVGQEGRSFQTTEWLAMSMAQHLAVVMANLKLRAHLQSQAIRDPLTGLFNRRYLTELFDLELRRAERARHPVGVVMLDLDHFKRVNDTFGHPAGDALLREVAKVLKGSCRSGDMVCRYGGEEFILVLPNASLADTHHRAEAIRKIVSAQEVMFDNRSLTKATVSMGVAVFPHDGMTSESLIKAADAALYRAKHAGRNRVMVADLSWPEPSPGPFRRADRFGIRSS